MDNLYEILQCDETADYSDLKKAYSELALKYHPDKAHGEQEKTSTEIFSKISKAWKILSDPGLRKEYDIRWQERCLAQTYPIQDTVDFDEFEPTDNQDSEHNSGRLEGSHNDEDQDEARTDGDVCDGSYFYPCRCGGSYVLTRTDVQLRFDFVCCDCCSLTVQVLYTDNDAVS